MTTSSALTIDYGVSDSTDCSGELFEIPTTEVVGGDIVEIRIWARSHAVLEPYDLYKGTVSMGSGQYITTTSDDITEIVDFAETFRHQAEYPMDSIVSVEAITEIVIIDEDTNEVVNWATKGENVKNRFFTFGYSCLQQVDKIPLYGSVKLVYKRPPYYKLWNWVVPVGEEGLYWFFIYKNNLPKNKFSIELPDLTEGPAAFRNITIVLTSRSGGTPIGGASIYINDILYGTTDVNGLLDINGIQVGTYSIKGVATGFVDTDEDDLYNDTIHVY